MPEGPSIVILKEAAKQFAGKKVISASGNSKQIAFDKINGNKIIAFKSWGKHFLICFPTFTLRVHFLLFGSYRINEKKYARSDTNTEIPPRLSLQFAKGELNFYACSIKEIDADLDTVYDWSVDVLSDSWNEKKAIESVKKNSNELVCDVLLNQEIFAGVGNIIKNEVLYRIKLHPLCKVRNLPLRFVRALVHEAVRYSYDFLKWKKEFTLRKHWLVHTKKICQRDNSPIQKIYAGKTKRRTFFCKTCQPMYT
ncbi:MAG TPA: endonuclease [Flavobacteriales bacterium]|nr:endonuclease [Flavobacteriales bacterium]